mmetsp:Transcript_25899/g.83885  ORF Transcript_25899/g.83885 Transcript_25899/m.83885 type:complete len:255 (+) Transcript_25899:167-931(+)
MREEEARSLGGGVLLVAAGCDDDGHSAAGVEVGILAAEGVEGGAELGVGVVVEWYEGKAGVADGDAGEGHEPFVGVEASFRCAGLGSIQNVDALELEVQLAAFSEEEGVVEVAEDVELASDVARDADGHGLEHHLLSTREDLVLSAGVRENLQHVLVAGRRHETRVLDAGEVVDLFQCFEGLDQVEDARRDARHRGDVIVVARDRRRFPADGRRRHGQGFDGRRLEVARRHRGDAPGADSLRVAREVFRIFHRI